ncbi:flagellar hook-length control protein FliK [Desulforamulus ferrireducens]|uniref:Flagellar hook-length control protein FliK n=1 Tax=Desulforamulus ferrireducens TaxID=1833852 RepID=A0A1S6ITA9_9FIRM|nr:flagellar hook-length control protein FliK [Desulforamulus ferrireducens]AQS58005.1 flagellar hook-length control protein FliK [Desulforamulus ferrireducens]
MIDRVMSILFRSSENMRVTPSKQVDKINQNPFTLEQNLAATATKEASKIKRPHDAKPTDLPQLDRQEQPPYVPLPLRTPLYKDAKFYWKLRDLSAKVQANGEAKVIFSVNTTNLGLLWFTLSTQENKHLSVQCITETSALADIFRSSAELLQRELTEVGYESVLVSCRMQPGIRSIADLDPEFVDGTSALLNIKV